MQTRTNGSGKGTEPPPKSEKSGEKRTGSIIFLINKTGNYTRKADGSGYMTGSKNSAEG